jgi:tRNA-binding EMAP/Myf-like protein
MKKVIVMKYLSAKHFERLNLRVGKIKAVKKHPKVDEYILLIDLGPVDQDAQIIADLKKSYKMKDLIGKQVVFLENFKHTTIGGLESQGLLLVTHKKGKPVLIKPDKKVLTGVQVGGLQDTTIHYHHKPGEHGKY